MIVTVDDSVRDQDDSQDHSQDHAQPDPEVHPIEDRAGGIALLLRAGI